MGKTLVERLNILRQREGIDDLDIPVSRFGFFKELFGKTGKMAKINLLAVMFCLPAIVWMIYRYFLTKTYDASINYSGNIGLGYSMIDNAEHLGAFAKYAASIIQYAFFVPLAILASVGIGGAFFALRKLAQGDDRIVKNFFKGIKSVGADFFIFGLIASLIVFAFKFNLVFYDAYQVGLAWKITGLVVTSVIALFVLCILLYACTMSVSYKAGFMATLKNSFLFLRFLPVQSVIMAILAPVPFVVLAFMLPLFFVNANNILYMLVSTAGVLLFLFLGISFIAAAWTIYTDYVYELGFGAAKAAKKSDAKKAKKQNSR